jgi:hypothetical protein
MVKTGVVPLAEALNFIVLPAVTEVILLKVVEVPEMVDITREESNNITPLLWVKVPLLVKLPEMVTAEDGARKVPFISRDWTVTPPEGANVAPETIFKVLVGYVRVTTPALLVKPMSVSEQAVPESLSQAAKFPLVIVVPSLLSSLTWSFTNFSPVQFGLPVQAAPYLTTKLALSAPESVSSHKVISWPLPVVVTPEKLKVPLAAAVAE